MRLACICFTVLASLVVTPSSTAAAPLLLVQYDSFLDQITGCGPSSSSCFGRGFRGAGLLEFVLEADTRRILAASPMFHVTEAYSNPPRFVRFSGSLQNANSDCELLPGELTPCYMIGVGGMTQLEGVSAGANRDFVIEPWGYSLLDPVMGLVPEWFETRERGQIDGRDVWFWGNASFRSVTAVNSNLAPVPEPGSLTLLGIGAVGVWLRRRHRSARRLSARRSESYPVKG